MLGVWVLRVFGKWVWGGGRGKERCGALVGGRRAGAAGHPAWVVRQVGGRAFE